MGYWGEWRGPRLAGLEVERADVGRLSLSQRFLIGSLVILVVGMTGIGLWVSRRIEDGIVHRTASTTALYVDSLIAISLQDLSTGPTLSEKSVGRLDWLIKETTLGQQVALFRVWDRGGRIVYSTDPATVGQQLPIDDELTEALKGEVTADIGSMEGDEALPAGQSRNDLLEIYSPVRGTGTNDVIAVAEFYYGTAEIRADIAHARRESWLVVGAVGAVIYVLLAIFVQRASNTIVRQGQALAAQVGRLTELLAQNEELSGRVRGAAARTTALNERFLRRVAAELHDGPAQDISLALLRLDHVAARRAVPEAAGQDETARDLDAIQDRLRHALQEVRSSSSDLMLPRLGELDVAGVVEHAVRAHRRRTRTEVAVTARDLPTAAALPTKIALYRIIQEALTNAARHAGAAGQAVTVTGDGDALRLVVADAGTGFDVTTMGGGGGDHDHLGLLGMRERAESLGGTFAVSSNPDDGTRVTATLPVHPTEERDG